MDGSSVQLHGSARLAARIAVSHPLPVRRTEAAAELWPGAAKSQASNSFRVALSRLRRDLPEHSLVDSDPSMVGFSPGICCDLAEARAALAAADGELDPRIKLDHLGRKIDALRAPLLAGWDDPWVEDLRAAWSLEAAEALESGQTLAEECEDWPSLLAISSAALALDGADSAALEALALAHAMLGQAAEAGQAVSRLRRLCGKGPGPRLAAALAGQGPSQSLLSEEQALAVGRMVEQLLADDPAAVRQLLGHARLRQHFSRIPQVLLPVLEAAVAEGEPSALEDLRCLARAAMAASMANQWTKSVGFSQRVLDKEVPPVLRKATLLCHGYACHALGRTSDAYLALEEAARIADETGDLGDAAACRVQIATTLALDGRYKESLEGLLAQEPAMAEHHSGSSDLAVVHLNIALALYCLDRPQEASHRCRQGMDVCRAVGTQRVDALGRSVWGASLAASGDVAGGAIQAAAGLGAAWRMGQTSSLAVALVHAARVLAEGGSAGLARAAAFRVREMAAQGLVPATVLLGDLAEKVLSRSGDGVAEGLPAGPGEACRAVYRQLRVLARRG